MRGRRLALAFRVYQLAEGPVAEPQSWRGLPSIVLGYLVEC